MWFEMKVIAKVIAVVGDSTWMVKERRIYAHAMCPLDLEEK